jgi:hypothetical protein
MNKQPEQQHTHQVVADGQVIYEGDDWPAVFLGARLNPDFGTIMHLEDGKPGAAWSPPVNQSVQHILF